MLKRAQAGHPLFTAEWNPSQYDDGQVHHLTMLENKIQFSLTSSPSLGLAELISKIVLFFNWSQVTQGAFGCAAASVILPLSFLRSSKSQGGKMQKIAKNDHFKIFEKWPKNFTEKIFFQTDSIYQNNVKKKRGFLFS